MTLLNETVVWCNEAFECFYRNRLKSLLNLTLVINCFSLLILAHCSDRFLDFLAFATQI